MAPNLRFSPWFSKKPAGNNARPQFCVMAIVVSILVFALLAGAEYGGLLYAKLSPKHLIIACVVVAEIGLIVMLKGWASRRARAENTSPDANDNPPDPIDTASPSFGAQHFGVALIFATILNFAVFYFPIPGISPSQLVAQARTATAAATNAPAASQTNAAAIAASASSNLVAKVAVKKPAVFPPLKLNGLVVHGTNSSAIINSKSYFMGDSIGDAHVTAITQQSVTLELDGETKTLYLE